MGTSVTLRSGTRDLHPLAWWVWALGLAAAASRTTNPLLLGLVVGVACLVVVLRRTDAPWALGFRLYLLLGLVVVLLRLGFRVLFGSAYAAPDAHVLLDLPQVPLPDWTTGLTLLGPVTAESLGAGFADGLRLATILVCVGAANTLANPRRLLAALPAALYEVGAAVVIALSLFPQLAESVDRVRRARRLRGDVGRGIGALRRIVVPVLEDALDRSLDLAAGMDARGYGRRGSATPGQRRLTATLLLTGLVGVCVGAYAVLDSAAPRWLGGPLLVVAVVAAVGGVVSAGARVERTRYRPDLWRLPESLVAGAGIAACALVVVVAHRTPAVAYPAPALLPPLTVTALLVVVAGLLPLLVVPDPRLREEPEQPLVPAPAPREEVTGRDQVA
ncbi:CbiQ family ECF transporter T component [Nocardioides marmoribigeumensis]|uniref:Energy-coupling factor transport system permease protein n=1 Tax=Nocardioides marmoribigeumensis TaxID=433649 RepID=A0ABU2C0Z4_9ACTN|nr:CbiQ family ECF transporter T component [Nocardioides marmoribigeumensis]MDR7364269.1 energy-coupling factor transport system permease protein [Nocardioides marmoribigeumensis]